MSDAFTVFRQQIPETPVEGRPLGRHVYHDSRSLAYRIEQAATIESRMWDRDTPVLDQGSTGSCTGNASCGALGTSPFYGSLSGKLKAGLHLDENEALNIYGLATQLDPFSGTYPPDDTGSNGLSAAKACQQLGLISGYTHALSLTDLLSGLQTGPMIVGTNWYEGMDDPDGTGLVQATGAVRGGHEYECIGLDVDKKLLWFVNSWGTGYGQEGRFCYSYDTMTKLLSEQGDATKFVPISEPAPTPTPVPTPTPGAAPFPGATVPVAEHVNRSAGKAHLAVTDWLNHHFGAYFDLHTQTGEPSQVVAGREND